MANNFLTEKETAKKLNCSTRTLQRGRVHPDDDPLLFIRAGRRILYLESDVDDWLLRRRYHSTAEADLAELERAKKANFVELGRVKEADLIEIEHANTEPTSTSPPTSPGTAREMVDRGKGGAL